jgi:hypothetical protein
MDVRPRPGYVSPVPRDTDPSSIARRLALVQHIDRQWYPRYAGAWLKAAVLDEILDPPLRAALIAAGDDRPASLDARRNIVEHFIDIYLRDHMSEASRWGEFYDDHWRPVPWRPIAGAELRRAIDEVIDLAAARMVDPLLDPSGLMTDLPALRAWFTRDLWASAEPTWWTFSGSPRRPGRARMTRRRGEAVVIGLDDDIAAMLWLP